MGNTDSYLGRLISELRRRRVFRTAALYIVGAWLVMQVADVVFPALGISERAMRFVLIGAVLGFPIALVFGWLYDIGAHGIRRTEEAADSGSVNTQGLRRTDFVILSALGIVVVAIVYNAISGVVDAPHEDWTQDPDRPPMIAVLPFVATNAAGASESFAAGVHDDLLTQLSKIQSIRVISRTSVMGYKDTVRNIREIGESLGADTILEGGVQSAGNRIRINAQLIDARTDEHLWAETYDRELTLANIFEVQSEIARAITSAMRATLTKSDADALAVAPTENMDAYRAYHEALEFRDNRGSNEDIIAALDEAVALDPMFTRAWAEMVGVLSAITYNRQEYEVETVKRAAEALEHIRSIAPESPDYVIANAYYTYYTLQDYERALQLIVQAQKMVPSDAHLLEVASWIQRRAGDYEGRIESLRRARVLDPKEPKRVNALAMALITSHHYDEALSVLGNAEFEDYRLSSFEVVLRIKEHRDFDRSAEELKALQREFDVSDDYYSLWEAAILTRNFQAAEELLGLMPGSADDPDQIFPYLQKLQLSIETYFFMGKHDALMLASSQLRSALDSRRAPDGSIQYSNNFLDLALLEAVAGNTDEATRLVRQWGRFVSDDLAGLMVQRGRSCSILAMAGAATEAVDCLREALVEPSWAMPFMDPYYPNYDLIRDDPEFIGLLAELKAKSGN